MPARRPLGQGRAALLLTAMIAAGTPAAAQTADPSPAAATGTPAAGPPGGRPSPAPPGSEAAPPPVLPSDKPQRPAMSDAAARAAERAAKKAERQLVPFAASPFPYEGAIPGKDVPFMGRDEQGAFHDSPRGGRLREEVYDDRRSIVFVPPRFDPRRADALLILFFHGNSAMLARDVVVRQRVPQQLAASRLNAVLVAPQMAKDALDSSAGQFWTAGFLDRYLDEAAQHIAAQNPAARSRRRFTAAEIERLPVVIVAYSGGYLPTAFSLVHAAKGRHRIEGVVLLDALFGEDDKFAAWIESPMASPFFVSLYSKSSSDNNEAMIARLRAKFTVEDALPEHIGPGTIAFAAHLDASHDDFVTDDGIRDPLADVLRRIGEPGAEADRRRVAAHRRGRRGGDAEAPAEAKAASAKATSTKDAATKAPDEPR